ncbi:hypothetical protein PGT21_019683 [Puccinia graminis f. sp. tritici]|uniref:Uncharacterized protein n=1 Tax=Puccinia graminis f. sp. tritici TaxID=56615 RepID=A0A5B0QIX5_PUCGR|nr:hypothetical protein PGT21_019683 [Puccinia graminis f. sp. tritici]
MAKTRKKKNKKYCISVLHKNMFFLDVHVVTKDRVPHLPSIWYIQQRQLQSQEIYMSSSTNFACSLVQAARNPSKRQHSIRHLFTTPSRASACASKGWEASALIKVRQFVRVRKEE